MTVNVVLNDPDLNFQGQTFPVAILTSIGWKMQTLLLPSDGKSNGATANVVHHDFDLHFQVYKFLNVNISKMARASEKC